MEVGIKVEYSFPSTFTGEKCAKAMAESLKPIATVNTRINTQRIIVAVDYGRIVFDADRELERWMK